MRKSINHKDSLELLCSPKGLIQINEHFEKIRLIVREPMYLKGNHDGSIICPDLFLGYINKDWTVIEYKNSRKKRDYAAYQIESGKFLLHDFLDVPLKNITGKFVTPKGHGFQYEII